MGQYILPSIFLIISGFVFLQNKKPLEERALAFDDPWGPIIYILSGVVGIYLFLKIGVLETVVGWFISLFIAFILNGALKRTQL